MLREVKGGKNTYGIIIGIMLLERTCPRIPGDNGNATTFNFPVRLYVVKGIDVSTRWRIFEGDKQLLEPFIKAAKQLEQEGVRAITSSCGFLIQFQDLIAETVGIPVFMSSLLQIPVVYRMLPKGRIIGVITTDASPRGLGRRQFEAAGAGDIPIVTTGMEGSEAFDAIAKNKDTLYPEKIRDDIVDRAKKLVRENPNVGALVLECHNMPPYAKAIQDAVNLPVFDAVTLTNWVYSALVRQELTGYM